MAEVALEDVSKVCGECVAAVRSIGPDVEDGGFVAPSGAAIPLVALIFGCSIVSGPVAEVAKV